MQAVEEVLSAGDGAAVDQNTLRECIEECADCGLTCTACADACLSEKEIDPLRRCIRLDQDCADACALVARVLSRRHLGDAEFMRMTLEACARICAACGAECQRHAAHHEHCRICAEACRRCEEACRRTARALPAA